MRLAPEWLVMWFRLLLVPNPNHVFSYEHDDKILSWSEQESLWEIAKDDFGFDLPYVCWEHHPSNPLNTKPIEEICAMYKPGVWLPEGYFVEIQPPKVP